MTTIKLSAFANEIEFDLEIVRGEMTPLKVVEFTVGDIMKVIKLQDPIFKGVDVKKVTPIEVNKLMVSRMVCAVKHRETNEYFWNIDNVDDFDFDAYPNTLLKGVAELVDKVNPVVSNLEEEKKSS